MFIINVTGEIIAEDKNHYAQNWACRSIGNSIDDCSYHYDRDNHTVQSNLVLNKNIRAVPYAIYVTNKGIQAQPPSDLTAAPGAMAAQACYNDNIAEIEDLFDVTIPPEIEVYFYNGLLTGIFSVLELFLSDVLLCLIFWNQEVYDRALAYMKDKDESKWEKANNSDPDMALQKYFTDGFVYHRFDKVRTIFKKILQIRLPNSKNIQFYLHKRNNIAHRFAFSNIDRMQMTVIDMDTLKELISCCNEFVDKIMKEINKKY